MLMRRSVVLDNLAKTIPPIDPDQRVALLHAPFRGTTLFRGELAKVYRANKERASSVTVYQAAPLSLTPYTGHGRSFSKGGSSYRRSCGDRVRSRSAPLVHSYLTQLLDPFVLSIVAKGYRLCFTSPHLLLLTPWEI